MLSPMGELIRHQINLASITTCEVEKYAGHTNQAVMYAILDDERQRYGVVIVPEDENERPAYMAVLARVVNDRVIIEEDGTLDKPLVEALMHKGGIPREQIVLAYKGERLPEKVEASNA